MSLTTRRILSVVVAVVAAGIGGPLLWVGGAGALIATEQTRGDPASAALAVVGIILSAVSIATVLISALGVAVVGVLHGLIAFVALIVPFDPLHHIQSPVWTVLNALSRPGTPLSIGLTIFIATGTSLLVGSVYAMAGLGRRGRTVARGPARGVLGVALGTPLMLLGAALALFAGGLVYRATFVTLRGEPLGVAVVVLGVLMFAFGVLVDARYSGWGEVITGALTLIAGVALFAAPGLALRVLGPGWAPSLSLVGPSLFLVALGVLLVVSGVCARVLAARGATAAPIAG